MIKTIFKLLINVFLLIALIIFPLSIILSLFIPNLWIIGLSLYLLGAGIIGYAFLTRSQNAAKLASDPVKTITFLVLLLFWGFDIYINFISFFLSPILPKKDLSSKNTFELEYQEKYNQTFPEN